MADTFIKDRTSGKVYKLSSGGYYQPYSGDTGGTAPTETGGVADYYSQLAKTETDPYYNQQTTATQTQTAADLANTKNRLAALYTDQGMGNSSFYTGADTSATNVSNQGLSSRLADIERARTGEYQTRTGNYMATQRAGEQQDWEAEQNRIAAEREQQRWEQEMALSMLKAKSGARSGDRGSPKSQTQFEFQTAARQALNQDIKGAIADWAARENDRLARGEARGMESEDIYIPRLISEYSQYGLKPEDIAAAFYAARKPYESKYGR